MESASVELNLPKSFRTFCQMCLDSHNDNLILYYTIALFECAFSTKLEGDKLRYWKSITEPKLDNFMMIDAVWMALYVLGHIIRNEKAIADQIMEIIATVQADDIKHIVFVPVGNTWWVSATLPEPDEYDDTPTIFYGPIEAFQPAYNAWIANISN